MVNYGLIGVEGNHDQAFIGKVLKLLGLKDFREAQGGLRQNLDPFWSKLVPYYPNHKGELYKRLPMPSILYNENLSVALYSGEGSNLMRNLEAILMNEEKYQTDLYSFTIIADADTKSIDEVIKPYTDCFQEYFPNFPQEAGYVDESSSTATGIYVLPDNSSQGTLDRLLCQCGKVAYPQYMERAENYLERFTDITWKKFDYDKALVASIVSVLKPGKTNTTSINDNNWVSKKTQQQVTELQQLVHFLSKILNL